MYIDREERALIEQHIESVTCMDLPLDWDNLYYADVRAQGVHTESISDALVICLNTLGMVDIEYISKSPMRKVKALPQERKAKEYLEDVHDDVKEAVSHIAKHSTHHSESIITENDANAAYFTQMVDSAAVYVNASTRFTDGGEFGLGCEIGISTQKIHARGPMGLCEMNTYKYVIQGNGQIR